MNIKPNPFGLHTVTPYLVVNDVARLIDFLEKVFDAEVRGNISRDGHRITHTEVVIGDSVLMMGEPADPAETKSSLLYVYVDHCDQRYAMALAKGATEVKPPSDQPHGDRFGGVRDFAGNLWWIVEHVGRAGASNE